MKTRYQKLLSFILLPLAIACNSNTHQSSASNTESADTSIVKAMIPDQTCYAGAVGRDSIFLKTEHFPNVVTGTLAYRFFEKDQSHGEIDGVMSGDTLIADYTFTSEGTKSVRQVAFLLQNDMAIEGVGEMEEKDGKMVFKNISGLTFGQSFKLMKAECK